MITTQLVVGDAHVSNKQKLSRFEALGNMVEELKPDQLIFMGDFLSLDSLSSWDSNKRKTMEGRRFWKEIQYGNGALDLALRGKAESTDVVYLNGNHEDRLDRYFQTDPTFDGGPVTIPHVLRFKDRGIKNVPYRSSYNHRGVVYTHIPMGGHNKPIGGVRICHKALQLYNQSVVFGHTHKLEIENLHRHGAKHLQQALNCGCFFEHTDPHQGVASSHWRGVLLLKTYDYMRFDINTYSMRELYNNWS